MVVTCCSLFVALFVVVGWLLLVVFFWYRCSLALFVVRCFFFVVYCEYMVCFSLIVGVACKLFLLFGVRWLFVGCCLVLFVMYVVLVRRCVLLFIGSSCG